MKRSAIECVLGTDRFANAIGADRTLVDAARNPVIVWSRLSEVLLEKCQRLRLEIAADTDAEPFHLGAGRRDQSHETCRRAAFRRKPAPILGVMTNKPSGLRWLEAILARNLLYETPADAVSPVSARIRARISSAISVAEAMLLQVFGDVEIGLIERERLDQRGVLGKNLADLTRHRFVDVEMRWHENQLRAFSLRRHRRHGGVDAEFAGLVARGRHDSALARDPPTATGLPRSSGLSRCSTEA